MTGEGNYTVGIFVYEESNVTIYYNFTTQHSRKVKRTEFVKFSINKTDFPTIVYCSGVCQVVQYQHRQSETLGPQMYIVPNQYFFHKSYTIVNMKADDHFNVTLISWQNPGARWNVVNNKYFFSSSSYCYYKRVPSTKMMSNLNGLDRNGFFLVFNKWSTISDNIITIYNSFSQLTKGSQLFVNSTTTSKLT